MSHVINMAYRQPEVVCAEDQQAAVDRSLEVRCVNWRDDVS